MKKGFTLLELLIVIVIMGILVSIAVPNFTGMVEKARADQAITYLKVIRTGEKIYYASNTRYTACTNAAGIKSKLGAEVTEESYTFSVTSSAPTTFLATASRNNMPVGSYKKITIDQDGNIVQTERGVE